jgi:hypothetical protein
MLYRYHLTTHYWHSGKAISTCPDILETDLKYHTIYKWFACHFKIEILIKSNNWNNVESGIKHTKPKTFESKTSIVSEHI